MARARPSPRPGGRPIGGPPQAHSLWLWIIVSGGLHVLALVISFGVMGAGLLAGHGVRTGTGFGGQSVELEIQGERDGPAHGSIQPNVPMRATPEPAEPEPEPQPEPVIDEQGAEAITAEVEEPRPDPRERVEAQPSPRELEGAPEGEQPGPAVAAEEGAPGATEDAAGTGGDDSTAGAQAGDSTRDLILGSAGLGMGDAPAARSALLPNGGRCDDPVAGTWRVQKFRPTDRTWVRFIMRVRRQGDELSGTITSRIWTGRPSNPSPGECTAFGFDHTWQMTARGRIDGERMTFEATRHRLIRQDCPSSARTMYAPDHFTGTVDPMREIFDSTNNDGAFDIDEPYLFRRVSCE